MASKTLARAGSSLINRLFHSSASSNALRLHQLGSTSPCQSFLSNLTIRDSPRNEDLRRIDEESINRLMSQSEISFPCGLPSLRFFIEEGNDALSNEPMLLHTKRTYQPSNIKRKRAHGFLARWRQKELHILKFDLIFINDLFMLFS
ncbi:hypothetical protein LUZ63_019248 [Rhynchospora breviuscula]|uniref:Ribosomal protein L34 n=1 Tax=Rhynchospora breviuscula TaxID=2022672 RepID=A0A9Q0C5X0_9POAL|nr:hypothetical protein LUZ63_019248 [Rhynchospora breviuscula]